MTPSTGTKIAERRLEHDLNRLRQTGQILASKIQGHAETISRVTHGISNTVNSPKRLARSVKTNPGPYVIGVGAGIAIYAVAWLLKRLSRNIYIDRDVDGDERRPATSGLPDQSYYY